MKPFHPIDYVQQIAAFGHRQGKAEARAAEHIMQTLDAHDIPYTTEYFTTNIPEFAEAELWADGTAIPAIATSFVSGEITDKGAIISSMISSQRFIDDANINFNPYCHDISRSNHYFAPSLAVAPKYLEQICAAKDVHGKVTVKKQEHRSVNIIVGNPSAATAIVMGHYDSIGPGVIDNASGTALLMDLALHHSHELKQTAIIFSGNEELSYDYPIYWGHGYRVLEKKHLSGFDAAEKIIGVDCIGHAPAVLYDDVTTVKLGIPLTHLEKWSQKSFLLSGDLRALNPVYHSAVDDGSHVPVTQKYYDEAKGLLLKILCG